MHFKFPKDFMWGVASSAYQIEAACREGGKKPTVYDHFSRLYPERFKNAVPDDAADFYHRYREDIALMKQGGIQTFRFSICWARIMNDVDGEINQAGIDYYNNVIDCLLENGITPFFDLYHCDLPMFVIEKGGPKNPAFVDWFVRYAEVCFTHFGDRVKLWSTVNEPVINIFYAHAEEFSAPFEKDFAAALRASHHMLLAHFKTVKLYRSMNLGGKIGAVNYFIPTYPKSLDPKDVLAADRSREMHSGWWFETMLNGTYPELLTSLPYIHENMPPNYAQELADAFERMDFVGVNYYHPSQAEYIPDGKLEFRRYSNPLLPVDDYGFEFYPAGLFDSIMFIKEKYGDPLIYITENGTALYPKENLEDDLNDQHRINHMREHLREVSRCIQAGANVKGYYHWSFLDTYEGNSTGYLVKFGLVRVDMKDLSRRPRRSFEQYRQWITNNTVD